MVAQSVSSLILQSALRRFRSVARGWPGQHGHPTFPGTHERRLLSASWACRITLAEATFWSKNARIQLRLLFTGDIRAVNSG